MGVFATFARAICGLGAWFKIRDEEKTFVFYSACRPQRGYAGARAIFRKQLARAGLENKGYGLHRLAVNYGAAHIALAMTIPGDTTTAGVHEVEKMLINGSTRVDRLPCFSSKITATIPKAPALFFRKIKGR